MGAGGGVAGGGGVGSGGGGGGVVFFRNGLKQCKEEEEQDATEQALTDLPQMFSDAVLYKIVEDIDQQLQRSQKVSMKEQRQS